MKKLTTVFLVILNLWASIAAAETEPFRPPRKLTSDVDLQGYHSGNYSRSVDSQWLSGLQKSIAAQFDGAVILDVGYMNRPHPEFRNEPEGTLSAGHGVMVLARKGDRIYIYGTDLTIMSSRLGIATELFSNAVEAAKHDKSIKDWGEAGFFLEVAKFAAAGAAVFGSFLVFSTDPAITEGSILGLVLTGAGSVVTYGASKLSEFTEGKQRILNKTQKALNALTSPSEKNENRFHRYGFSDLSAFEKILKQVVDQSLVRMCKDTTH